ncbi:MAG: type VII secretion AAA-ATPase EccA, partial [Mycolicibacter sinensis]
MTNGDAALLTPQPRVDEETLSRFATCCRALGIPVHQRQRPADLTAARAGFAALTRIAHEQCDA